MSSIQSYSYPTQKLGPYIASVSSSFQPFRKDCWRDPSYARSCTYNKNLCHRFSTEQETWSNTMFLISWALKKTWKLLLAHQLKEIMRDQNERFSQKWSCKKGIQTYAVTNRDCFATPLASLSNSAELIISFWSWTSKEQYCKYRSNVKDQDGDHYLHCSVVKSISLTIKR